MFRFIESCHFRTITSSSITTIGSICIISDVSIGFHPSERNMSEVLEVNTIHTLAHTQEANKTDKGGCWWMWWGGAGGYREV